MGDQGAGITARPQLKIGVLCSRVRLEEKLILAAFRARGVGFERIDPRRLVLDLQGNGLDAYDAILVRCLSHSRAYYLTRLLEGMGVLAISPHRSVATCGDKVLTTVPMR